jgi:hypothetical protein
MASGRMIFLGGDAPPGALHHVFLSVQPLTKSQDSDVMKLEKLLSGKNDDLRTTKNAIAKIGKGNSHGRLETLQKTHTRLEKEIQVLDWTGKLYNMVKGPEKRERGDNTKQDTLWTAIADSKLRFQKEIGADVWKTVDFMLEQLWKELGNTEPHYASENQHSTGYEAEK